MFKELHGEFTLLKTLIILLVIAVAVHLFTIFWQVFNTFSDVIVIVVLAWLLSFVLEPLVDAISNLTKLSRLLSTIVTFVLMFLVFAAIIFLFIPLVAAQIQTLTKVLPLYMDTAPKFLVRSFDSLTQSLNNAIAFIPSVAQFFFSTIIVLVISFYFILDKTRINKEFYDLTPTKWHRKMKFIQETIETTFASFLRVQLTIGIISGIVTWIILTLLGINFAASVAFLSGVLAIVPLVGPALTLIPAVFVAFIVDPVKGLIVFLVLLIAQQFIFNVFVPRALGHAYKMHPVIIIISSIVGYKVAGWVGALFAIPILGIATIVLRDIGHKFLNPEEW